MSFTIARSKDYLRIIDREIIHGLDTREAQDDAMDDSNKLMLAVIMANEDIKLRHERELNDLEEMRLVDKNWTLFRIRMEEQNRIATDLSQNRRHIT